MSNFDDSRLGEKFNVLPYPGEIPPMGFAGEDADAPFRPSTQGTNAPGIFSQEKSYPASKEQSEPQQAQKAPSPQPREQNAIFAASGDTGPRTDVAKTRQLSRFREIFGLKRIAVQNYTVTTGLDGEEVSMTFSLRPLSHEDYQWVVNQAASIRVTDYTASLTFRLAVVAMAICGMEEGVVEQGGKTRPIWEVFGIQPEKPEQVRDPYYPQPWVRYEAATAMWNEVRNTFYDFIDEIYLAHETLINEQTTIVKDKSKGEGENNPLAQTTSDSSTPNSGSVDV